MNDTILMTFTLATLTQKTWIADSGASSHITNKDTGLYDICTVKEPVRIGNGKTVYATKIGKLNISIAFKDGSHVPFMLNNVQYIPGFWVKLFSLTVAIAKGCTISNKGHMIVVQKNDLMLEFNPEIKTPNGFVCGIMMTIEMPTGDLSYVSATMKKPQDINELHCKLGHVSEDAIQKTAKFYDWKLKNKFQNCGDCALAKSRQKIMNKEPHKRSEMPGEHLFIDTSSIKEKSLVIQSFGCLHSTMQPIFVGVSSSRPRMKHPKP